MTKHTGFKNLFAGAILLVFLTGGFVPPTWANVPVAVDQDKKDKDKDKDKKEPKFVVKEDKKPKDQQPPPSDKKKKDDFLFER